MFYLVKISYNCPNRDDENFVNNEFVEIRDEPLRDVYKDGHPIVIKGDITGPQERQLSAWGAYKTLEEVREAISELFGDVYEVDPDGGNVIEAYGIGRYPKLTLDAAGDALWERWENDITPETTDEELETLLVGYEQDINAEIKKSLPDFTIDLMKNFRENYAEA